MELEKRSHWVIFGFTLYFNLLLVAMGLCFIAHWIMFECKPSAISNSGAVIGVIIASISARGAKSLLDRALLLTGLFVTAFFQIWSIIASYNIGQTCP
ncbi:hypothetical protein Q2Y23_002476 [Vibrio fluvialis]|nr:hypothetical protein [Vibrio fluvialis]